MSELATFGGGCFWCLEAIFQRLRGVQRVTPGYMGGQLEAPSYREVCGGQTGHAEVVQLQFDPARIRYQQLLEVFFAGHDPTTLNRQGHDVGSQYRSVVFCHSPAQQAAAQAALAAEAACRPQPVVTAVEAATRFWPAESEHQDYFLAHSQQPYCQLVIAPKLQQLVSEFASLLDA